MSERENHEDLTNGDETFEKMFDMLLDDASALVAGQLGDEYIEPESAEFSAQHEQQMRKLFQDSRKKLTRKKAVRFSQRAAVVLLVMLILSGFTVLSVEAWRIKFLNMFITDAPTKSEIVFVESTTHEDETIVLNYVPYGFALSSSNIQEDLAHMLFESGSSFFYVTIGTPEQTLFIDTEDAAAMRTKVNDFDAYLSMTGDGLILAWSDNQRAYSLSGNMSETEIRRIAENIK